MPDEQTTPEQGGTKSEEAPDCRLEQRSLCQPEETVVGQVVRVVGCLFVLVVLVLIIGGYGYLLYVNLNPDSGPDGFQVRRVASTASNYLSSDPSVTSAEATGAEANINGSSVTVDAHLKDGTSVEAPQPAGLNPAENTPAGARLLRRFHHFGVLDRQGQHHRRRRAVSTRP